MHYDQEACGLGLVIMDAREVIVCILLLTDMCLLMCQGQRKKCPIVITIEIPVLSQMFPVINFKVPGVNPGVVLSCVCEIRESILIQRE